MQINIFNIPTTFNRNLLFVLPLAVLIDGISKSYFYIILFPVIYFYALIHEFGHALTARFLGAKEVKVELNIMQGFCTYSTHSLSDSDSFWVALAGPAINIVCFYLLFPFIYFWPSDIGVYTLIFLAGFIVFNLMPYPLLDGYHCCYHAIKCLMEKSENPFFDEVKTLIRIGMVMLGYTLLAAISTYWMDIGPIAIACIGNLYSYNYIKKEIIKLTYYNEWFKKSTRNGVNPDLGLIKDFTLIEQNIYKNINLNNFDNECKRLIDSIFARASIEK